MESAASRCHGRASVFPSGARGHRTRLGQHADEATLQRICDDRVRAKARPFEHIEPHILTTIEHLRRRGLRLAVISNCFAEDVMAWPPVCPRVPVRLHRVLVRGWSGQARSGDLPRGYAAAGRDASDTWFIGDGQDDELSGAAQAGLRAFRALWFLKRWPHYREPPLPPQTCRTSKSYSPWSNTRSNAQTARLRAAARQ